MIVAVFGLPGSGKSYFAERLAGRLNAEYVNSDRVRKQLFNRPIYSESEKEQVYRVLLEAMQEALAKGRNLVLDATFHKRRTREAFAKRAGNGIVFLEVRAAEPVIRERLKKDRPYSDADFDVYESIRDAWEPLGEPHLILTSTNDNIDIMLQRAMEHLKDE